MQTQTEIDEIRRNAPLHYHARAEGARYAAWVLFELSNKVELPDGSEINMTASWEPTALNEAWLRERSFALESILKAAYAARQEGLPEPKAVPSTHNVLQLWTEVCLPKPSNPDRYRLLYTWQLLMWAGRYAAPNKGNDGLRGQVWGSIPFAQGSPALLERPAFEWSEFDSLYRRVDAQLWHWREVSGEGRRGRG